MIYKTTSKTKDEAKNDYNLKNELNAPKWLTASGKVSTPRFLGALSLNKCFDPSTPSLRKGRDRENGEKILVVQMPTDRNADR